jgi:Ca2+-binding RTX toxin-like protein
VESEVQDVASGSNLIQRISRLPQIGDEHNDTLIGGSDRVTGGAGADTIDVQEAPLSDGIDSVIGSDMTDTVFTDPADLLI